jgi:transposase
MGLLYLLPYGLEKAVFESQQVKKLLQLSKKFRPAVNPA